MKAFIILFCTVAVLLNGAFCQDKEPKPIKAVAVLKGSGTVRGIVSFKQSDCGQPVLIELTITGLKPGQHGFHIHEKGDLTQDCVSLGAHYNPDKLDHGAPSNEIRHVGDLGNVVADESGNATTKFSDTVISLTGMRSVIGRGVIVHEEVDDLGLGGHPDSKKTGNAGGRLACGVIGIVFNDGEDPGFPECGTGTGYRAFESTVLVTMLPVISILIVHG